MKPLVSSLLVLLLPFLAGCGSPKISPTLLEISEAAERRSPQEAAAMLDSLDPNSLSENDLYFCDILKIRIADKASTADGGIHALLDADTIIHPLMDYVEKNPDCGFYPEALFHAARLFSAHGDTYRALITSQRALKAIGRDSTDRALRSRILSHTGTLLFSLGNNSSAEKYFSEALLLDSIRSDSLALIDDRRNLGALHIADRHYQMARKELERGREIASEVSPADTSMIDIYLAEVDFHTFENGRGRRRIRDAVRNVPQRYLNMALAEAALIYYSLSISDTAAMYAMHLAWREEPSNLKIGSGLLMGKDLRKFVPSDSSSRNYSRYQDWIGDLIEPFGREGRSKGHMQTSMFNYTVHDRLRKKAEKKTEIYGQIALAAAIADLIFLSFFLITKSRKKQVLLELHEAIDKVNALNLKISEMQAPEVVDQEEGNPEGVRTAETHPDDTGNAKDEAGVLIERYKATLLARYKDATPADTDYTVPESIIRSEAYKNLRKMIKAGKPVNVDSKLWKQLDKAVCKAFPDFKRNFTYLTGKRMTLTDYHTALLIKCGITPAEMAIVLSIVVSSVSSRRSAISERIFGRNVGAATIDAIILSL